MSYYEDLIDDPPRSWVYRDYKPPPGTVLALKCRTCGVPFKSKYYISRCRDCVKRIRHLKRVAKTRRGFYLFIRRFRRLNDQKDLALAAMAYDVMRAFRWESDRISALIEKVLTTDWGKADFLDRVALINAFVNMISYLNGGNSSIGPPLDEVEAKKS